MNISMNNLMENNNTDQMSNKPVLNLQGVQGLGNLRFDSILNSISSVAVASGMEQYHNFRADENNSSFEKNEMHTAINNQKEERGQEDAGRKAEKNDSNYQADRNDNEYERNERPDVAVSDNPDNEAGQTEISGLEVMDDGATENNEQGIGQNAAATGEVLSDTDETANAVSGNDMDDQLISMLNDEAIVDINPATDSDQELNTAEGALSESNYDIANAVDDAELAAMLKNITGSPLNSELNSNEDSTEDGAGTNKILSEILDAKNQKDGDVQKNTQPVIDENADAEALDNALTELDLSNESETDDQFKTSESQGKVKTEGKTVNAENQLFSEQVKNLKDDSDDNIAKVRDIPKQYVKNTDTKQGNVEDLQLMENAETNEIPENNKEITGFNERLMSAVTQSSNSEGRLKTNENRSVNSVKASSGNNDQNMTGALNTVQSGGKLNGVLQTGNATRPAGLEVVDKIVYVVKGNNRLDVTINHKELGKLKIDLSIKDGTVSVNINTPDKAVKEFVENNIQQIISSMEKDGLDVGGFSVALQNQKGNEGFGQGRGNSKTSSGEKEDSTQDMQIKERVRNNNGNISVFA